MRHCGFSLSPSRAHKRFLFHTLPHLFSLSHSPSLTHSLTYTFFLSLSLPSSLLQLPSMGDLVRRTLPLHRVLMPCGVGVCERQLSAMARSLSLTHTHTHTHTLSLSLSLIRTHAHTNTHTLSILFSLLYAHTHTSNSKL